MHEGLKVVFHVKRPPPLDLVSAAAAAGAPVDDAQAERLLAFGALLAGRGVELGLVARSDRDRIHERHVLDCLRAATVVSEGDELAYDIGSGAGLPGIPVAIARPSLNVHLVEPRRVRVAFLEMAVERLGLVNVEVVAGRIEGVGARADLCLARAFAPAGTAWDAAVPRLRPGGRLIYFAGAGSAPVEAPPGCRSLEIVPAPSVVESAGPLVIMTR